MKTVQHIIWNLYGAFIFTQQALGYMLALAHHIERLVEADVIVDCTQAARLLGITRSRMAQIMNLLNLSPSIQEAILSARLEASERHLRPAIRSINWKEQEVQIGIDA